MINTTNLLRLFPYAFAALALLGTQTASAFPTGGGGCFFCSPFNLGGSSITFNLTSNDENGLAPITFNFLQDPIQDPLNPANIKTGRLCLSGKIHATIVSGTETGEAVYELLASDESNRGVCYENVTQTCVDITSDSAVGNCSSDKCTYTVPALQTIADSSTLLDGRFKVDTSLTASGPYSTCTPTSATGSICNFEVGFNDGITDILFPATTTLNGETVDANVVLYSNEVCIECAPGDLGLVPGTVALNSKSNIIRACEALTIKSNWCNDLQSTGPDCVGDNNPANPPRGGMNTAMGDFQIQDTSEAICVSDLDALKSLPSCETAIAIAACGDGPGFITFPESFQEATCSTNGSDAEIFFFSSAEGGGSTIVNMAAIGANPDAPGYAGDNTIPPVSPGLAAIISTPDNQVNIWDFSKTDLVNIAFTHSRNNNDDITGFMGPDTILGGSGADVLKGYGGNDVLQGGDNADQLFGGNENDLLLGYECDGLNAGCSSFSNNGSDNDTLNGGNGNDCIDGGRGNDSATGGAGNDAFVLFGNTDSDTIEDYTHGEDVVVDLTGNANVAWTGKGKSAACKITTGGSDAITVIGIGKADCVAANIDIVNELPEQCAGHPYSFQ